MTRLRRSSIRASAVVAMALASLIAAAPAQAARGLTTGFLDGAFASGSGEHLDEAVAAGAGIVRIPAGWPGVAPTRPAAAADPDDPAYRWDALDRAVAAARVRGLEVLLSIDQAPLWVQQGKAPRTAAPGSWKPRPRDVGAFATAVATRYATQARAVQLWNEPNLSTYLSPQWIRRKGAWRPFAPRRYRAMLNAAYPGVHAAGLRLVTAGTAPFGDPLPGERRIMPVRFWRAVLTAKTRFDVLAHHPYGVGGPHRKALNRDDVAIPDVHKLTRLVRDGVRTGLVLPEARKRFWITEVAWDSGPPDPGGVPMRRLAGWIPETLHVLWRQGVDTVLWYRVRDQAPVPSYDSTYQSGLYRVDGRPKALLRRAFAFPLTCERRGSRIRLWMKAPRRRTVRIKARSGETIRRLDSGSTGVVTARIRSHGAVRAEAGGRRSPICRS